MKRFVTICSLLLVLVLRAEAQRLAVEATLKGKAPEGLQLYLMSVAEVGQNRIDTFRVEGNKARVTTAVSPYAVYKLVGVAGQTQMIRPLSFPAGKGKAKMTVTFKDKQMNVEGVNADSKALMAFDDHYTAAAKKLWMDGRSMAADSVRTIIGSYLQVADDIIKRMRPSAPIADYLRVWAATSSFENLESIRFITGKDAKTLGLNVNGQAAKQCSAIRSKS